MTTTHATRSSTSASRHTRPFAASVASAAFALALAACGAAASGQAHLATFDDLDYRVFSNQQWADLHQSHGGEVAVHWPDGHVTRGIDKHIEDLKAMFVWAPDTRIKEHPIKIAQGEWIAVVGVMEGTFTQPMPAGDGKTIPPTGKAYKIQMATIGHWKGGVMDEEYLFWDNKEFMKQIGLGN